MQEQKPTLDALNPADWNITTQHSTSQHRKADWNKSQLWVGNSFARTDFVLSYWSLEFYFL